MSLNLDDPARVAGFVQPGSNVVVFLTTRERSGASTGQQTTRVLLPSVEVIATGATTVVTKTTTSGDTAQTEQLPKALLTLAVDQEQAQKIVFAQSQGPVTFGLLDPDSPTINVEDPGTTADNLFD